MHGHKKKLYEKIIFDNAKNKYSLNKKTYDAALT